MSLPYFTKGDNSALLLKATTDGSTVFNLTGATLITKFEKSDGGELSITNVNHTITDAANGLYKVDWSSADTLQLKARDKATFKTEVTQSGITQTIWFDCVLEIRESKIALQGNV